MVTPPTPEEGEVVPAEPTMVYEWMQQADWTRGPAGTGEQSYDGYI